MYALTKVLTLQKSISHCYRTNCIVCKAVLARQPLKIVVISRIELPATANNIAYNCS